MISWFLAHGDDLLAFLTMVGVMTQNQPGMLDPAADKWLTYGLAVLTIAHKVFFVPKSAQAPINPTATPAPAPAPQP